MVVTSKFKHHHHRYDSYWSKFKMSAAVCGFCRRGSDVSDVCGKLWHDEKKHCTAHQRCMVKLLFCEYSRWFGLLCTVTLPISWHTCIIGAQTPTWPALYRKTPVQTRVNLTVYMRTISGRVDLMCMYIVYFCIDNYRVRSAQLETMNWYVNSA